MTRPILKIDCYDKQQKYWRAVVETPKGGRFKYKYEPEFDGFSLHRILPEGMSFPFDFGFLPRTIAADGDPVDVLVVLEEPTFTGCVIPCRLIGVIEAMQTEVNGKTERNDRLIAIPLETRDENKKRSAKDLDKRFLKDVADFFSFYNQVLGKRFKVLGIRGPKVAEKLARAAMKRFEKPKK